MYIYIYNMNTGFRDIHMNTGFRVNSQVGYISIKLISHYISLHMLKPSVLDI